MEVLDTSSVMLSNYEVYSYLMDLQSGERGLQKPNKGQSNLATISYETCKYLENTPCKLQNEKVIQNFLQAVSSYKLTKSEKLQLLNQKPSSAVEIQLIVEESEERLTEEQIEELLQVIATTIPGSNPEEEAEEQGDEEEEEMSEEI